MDGALELRVEVVEALGGQKFVYGSFGSDVSFTVGVDPRLHPREGDSLKLSFHPESIHFFRRDAEFERLRGHAEFRDPTPVEIPWGPYKGGRACYLRDPDGISIQLMQQPPGGPNFGE